MTDHTNNSDDHPDDAVLARYLGGTCGPAERASVGRWLALDPAHQAEMERLKLVWNPPPAREADQDDRMWRWIAARMNPAFPRPSLVGPEGARRLWRAGLVAAALAAAAGGTLLLGRVGLWRGAAGNEAPVVPAGRELVTDRGERATGYLPDGSRVVLGPESRLRIPASFAGSKAAGTPRELSLQGEAFFEITHDSTRPLRVRTATGIAEDLGTEFVVTAYPETHTTRVVVASGKVELRSPGDSAHTGGRPTRLRLEPGDLGRIDASGSATLRRRVNLAEYVGWAQGGLVFDEAPLGEALVRLGRWYDVDIRLADPRLAGRRLTAVFHDEPFTYVLRTLEIALEVRAEQDGRAVTLRPLRAAVVPNR